HKHTHTLTHYPGPVVSFTSGINADCYNASTLYTPFILLFFYLFHSLFIFLNIPPHTLLYTHTHTHHTHTDTHTDTLSHTHTTQILSHTHTHHTHTHTHTHKYSLTHTQQQPH